MLPFPGLGIIKPKKAGKATPPADLKPTHDYVSYLPCGCPVEACYDTPNRFTAEWITEQIKRGRTIEHIPLDKLPELGCVHVNE